MLGPFGLESLILMAESAEGVEPAMVRVQLSKILANRMFAVSPALSRLLSFLVDQTIAGKADGLKEYTLAVKVLGRPESFDPRLDPVVRVQVSNLRSKLSAYYSGPGKSDAVRIELPRGGYIPTFTPARRHESEPGNSAVPSESPPVVTVLPCVDLSPNRDQEFFCDGVAEEITNALAGVARVRVTARTSAFSFKGQMQDVREIGARLGATVVLESSLRCQDARLRITARLTEVKSGTSLWSRSFNLKWGDIFSVQEAIARSIVCVLKIQFNGDDCDRIARSTHWTKEHYELYLLGKFHLNRVTPTNIERAMSLFRTVIARDPSNAPAHAALAKAWSLLALSGNAPVHTAMPKALKLVAKAQALDPHLTDVDVVLGIVQSLYQWKWQAAEGSFRRAIQSNPSHAEARSAYAFCVLLPTGRTSDAINQLLEAVNLDPVALNPRLVLALAYYARRDPALAVQQCKCALEVDPACVGAHAIHGLALTLLDDHVQAAHKAERVLQIAGNGPFGPSIGAAGCLFALAGNKPSAAACLAKLGHVEGANNHCWIALIDAALGRQTEALRTLASALKDRELWVPSVAYQPLADPLRSHARFRAFLRKMGLAG